MRRPFRWLTGILICVVASLWLTSHVYMIGLTVPLPGPASQIVLHQVRGHVGTMVWILPPPGGGLGWSLDALSIAEFERRVGPSIATQRTLNPPMFEFNHTRVQRTQGRNVHTVTAGVPHWLIVLILVAGLLGHLIRQRRKPSPHACPACGYDLRGSVSGDGASCPECGEAISEARKQAAARLGRLATAGPADPDRSPPT